MVNPTLLIENVPRLRHLAESKMLSSEGLSRRMDVIQFMDKSKNVAVGKGAGEHLASHVDEDEDLIDRAGYKDFVKNNGRKVLSNFFPSVVKVGGRFYPSVEHSFHAGKGYLINSANSIKEAEKFEVGGEYEFIEGYFCSANDCVANRELAIPLKFRKKFLRSFIVVPLRLKKNFFVLKRLQRKN
jgi:hypothetical protein